MATLNRKDEKVDEKSPVSDKNSEKLSNRVPATTYTTAPSNAEARKWNPCEYDCNSSMPKTLHQYAEAFRSWYWQYYLTMTYYRMQQPLASGFFPFVESAPHNLMPGEPNVVQNYAQHINHLNPNLAAAENRGGIMFPHHVQRRNNVATGSEREYRIPPIWKRAAAEMFDFFLLFIIKLGVTLLAVEQMNVINLEKYDLENLVNAEWDSQMLITFSTELITLEIINRMFICVFETMCLRRGLAGMVGGATPGKRLMGIKVVSCTDVIDVDQHTVRVFPGQDIGFWNAFARSLLKNFSMTFFVPLSLSAIFFKHNRPVYDIVTNCMVVEMRDEDWAWQRQ